MSDVDLHLDQENELRFNISIEGSRPGTPKYRLVLEGREFSYAFLGRQDSPGEVLFTIPALKHVMKEGNYRADLEVVIDDKFFSPLSFEANFEQSVKVTAESISRTVQKKPVVTAVFSKTPKPVLESSAPAPIEQKVTAPKPAPPAPALTHSQKESAVKKIREAAARQEIDIDGMSESEIRSFIRKNIIKN